MKNNEKLNEFRQLDKEEQIEMVNNLMKEIEGNITYAKLEKLVGFSNLSKFFVDYRIDQISRTIVKKNKVINDNNIFQEFSEEDLSILKEIIAAYKDNNNKDAKSTELSINYDDELITKTIRTYKNVIEEFDNYCKKNRQKKAVIIAEALSEYLVKNCS